MNETARRLRTADYSRRSSDAIAGWVIEALETGVAVVSLDAARGGRIEFVNATLAAMVGTTARELLGQPCTDLVLSTERERAHGFFQQIAAGSKQHIICHLAGPDGMALVADVHARVVEVEGSLRAVLEFRRWRSQSTGELLGPARVRLDLASCDVWVGDTAVPLSRTQFDVLAVLLERRGEVVSHAALVRAAWGVQEIGSSRNFIEAAISRLRRALQRGGADGVIDTVAGHGYLIR